MISNNNDDMQSCRSMISRKKQEMIKRRRTQHLQQYMSKIRNQLIAEYEHIDYVQLRDLISDMFVQRCQPSLIILEENQSSQTYSENNATQTQTTVSKLRQLLAFANSPKHSTVAIVAIAQLLLAKVITINMIEMCGDNKQGKPNEIMRIIKQQQNGDNSYGLLVLIRVLMTLGYCTQEMIAYCIRVVVQTKSPSEIQLSLEVLYILIVQKRLITIHELYKLTVDKSATSNVERLTQTQRQTRNSQQQQQQHLVRTQQLIYALMNHSLDSYVAKSHSQIRYYSTKLLSLSFRNEHIISDIVLTLIPLPRIAQHIKQKFLISSCYDKKKALQLLSDLLITLTNHNNYHPLQITPILSPLITHTMQYTRLLSQEIDANSLLRQKHNNNNNKRYYCQQQQHLIDDNNFRVLQQALFLIEVLVEDYLFGYVLAVGDVVELLKSFMIEHVLISLHSAYSRSLGRQGFLACGGYKSQESLEQQYSNEREGYSEYNLRRIVFLEKVKQLAAKMTSNLIKLSAEIRQGNIPTTTQQQAEKFLLLRNLIISRFRKSELQTIAERQLNLAGIDLNYV